MRTFEYITIELPLTTQFYAQLRTDIVDLGTTGLQWPATQDYSTEFVKLTGELDLELARLTALLDQESARPYALALRPNHAGVYFEEVKLLARQGAVLLVLDGCLDLSTRLAQLVNLFAEATKRCALGEGGSGTFLQLHVQAAGVEARAQALVDRFSQSYSLHVEECQRKLKTTLEITGRLPVSDRIQI